MEDGNLEWTTEDINRLRKLWDDGVKTREIAEDLGRTKNAVIGKARRMKLRRRLDHLPKDHLGNVVYPRQNSQERFTSNAKNESAFLKPLMVRRSRWRNWN